jgi:hypothetical protein
MDTLVTTHWDLLSDGSNRGVKTSNEALRFDQQPPPRHKLGVHLDRLETDGNAVCSHVRR